MKQKLQHWLERDPDSSTRQELLALIEKRDDKEISLRFSQRLAFGTAGLRGIVGVGTARMNRLVIRETSAGLANYITQSTPDSSALSIMLTYDGRVDSYQFAKDAACVFAASGLTVYLTERVAPTPIGAFGVTHLNCSAGVVITASHNPREYNGYKVYWTNGAQIIPPHDTNIAAEIDKASAANIPWLEFDMAVEQGKIKLLGEPFYQAYFQSLISSPLLRKSSQASAISIAYTALHGVGAELAESLLKTAGFNKVYSVESQREPDGSFPTVEFPNPEEQGVMDAVIALAKEKRADLACANDPDADRLAVAFRTNSGDYEMLSGDQIGILLGSYALTKVIGYTPIVCSSIVSSSMLKKIALAEHADFHQTLSGFKWLMNMAIDRENDLRRFLFAYEEALGYAFGATVFDKDGLSALLAFAQMSSELASKGLSIESELERLYRRFGLHLTCQVSIALDPDNTSFFDLIREQPLTNLGGSPVEMRDDFKVGKRRFANGSVESIDLPFSDIVAYHMSNAARVIVRPSGTEPKMKCYYEVVKHIAPSESFSTAKTLATKQLDALVKDHQQTLLQL